jgi:hypothetical protein
MEEQHVTFQAGAWLFHPTRFGLGLIARADFNVLGCCCAPAAAGGAPGGTRLVIGGPTNPSPQPSINLLGDDTPTLGGATAAPLMGAGEGALPPTGVNQRVLLNCC